MGEHIGLSANCMTEAAYSEYTILSPVIRSRALAGFQDLLIGSKSSDSRRPLTRRLIAPDAGDVRGISLIHQSSLLTHCDMKNERTLA